MIPVLRLNQNETVKITMLADRQFFPLSYSTNGRFISLIVIAHAAEIDLKFLRLFSFSQPYLFAPP